MKFFDEAMLWAPRMQNEIKAYIQTLLGVDDLLTSCLCTNVPAMYLLNKELSTTYILTYQKRKKPRILKSWTYYLVDW